MQIALKIDVDTYRGIEDGAARLASFLPSQKIPASFFVTLGSDTSGWAATRAVIHQAFKVMAIKDEVYVAHLLTSPEKRERDRARYRIDPSNGDRLLYRHLSRPEFIVFGKSIRWDMVTRDWQLQIMKRLKFLRRILPSWHRAEKDFRDWYLQLASHFDADDEKAYATWVQILQVPEEVRGYREIRRPAMNAARKKVERLLLSDSEENLIRTNPSLSVFCGRPRP